MIYKYVNLHLYRDSQKVTVSAIMSLIPYFIYEDERITHMYETVLDHDYPGGKWTKAMTTYLVCNIDGDDTSIIKQNDRKGAANKHAEELLIDALNENSKVKKIKVSFRNDNGLSHKFTKLSIDNIKSRAGRALEIDGPELLEITIYINNSPCSDSDHNCTGKLITFLENNVRVRMILYITNLYNIRRKSCKEEPHYYSVKEGVHTANYNGLKNLMQHDRCEIKAFTADDWEDLFKTVHVSEEVRGQLLDEYDNIMNDNDRSREDEDKRIMNDLEYIQNHD